MHSNFRNINKKDQPQSKRQVWILARNENGYPTEIHRGSYLGCVKELRSLQTTQYEDEGNYEIVPIQHQLTMVGSQVLRTII